MKKSAKIVVQPKPKIVAVAIPKDLYVTDFYKWTQKQTTLLKNRKFNELDIQNLLEEIESLGKSERKSIISHLTVLFLHLLKVEFQAEKKSKSWLRSIVNAQNEIDLILSDNHSFRKEMPKFIEKAYIYARREAEAETGLSIKVFPKECPKKFIEQVQILN